MPLPADLEARDKVVVTESVKALEGTIQVRKYKEHVRVSAVNFWIRLNNVKFGCICFFNGFVKHNRLVYLTVFWGLLRGPQFKSPGPKVIHDPQNTGRGSK